MGMSTFVNCRFPPFLFCIILVCLPVNLQAERSNPETVLAYYVGLIQDSNWDDIYSLVDKQAADELKQLVVEIISYENEYDQNGLQQLIFSRSVTDEEAKATSAAFYLSRLMKESAVALREEGFQLHSYEVLGSIKEGRDKAHLLLRVQLIRKDLVIENLQIHSFNKKARQWYIEPPANITQLLKVMELRYRR